MPHLPFRSSRRPLCSLCLCGYLLLAALVAPARAVIEIKMPVTKMVDATRLIVAGKLTKVDAAKNSIEVTVTDTLKGDKSPELLTGTISAQPTLAAELKEGMPIVLLYEKHPEAYEKNPEDPDAKPSRVMLVHAADNWYLGRSNPANPAVFSIAGPKKDSAADTFPGTTTAFLHVLKEIKAGKSTLINALGDRTLNTPEREFAKLPNIKNPTAFLAADFTGHGRPDLLICSAGKPHLFIATDKGYEDQTEKWGLKEATGDRMMLVPVTTTTTVFPATRAGATSAPIHPERTFVSWIPCIGNKIYDIKDGKFIAHNGTSTYPDESPRPDVPKFLAIAWSCFGEDPTETHLMGLTNQSLFRVRGEDVWRLGALGGTTALPPVPMDNDTRLTGASITQYHATQKEAGFKNPQLVTIDANGDGRPDLLIVADGGNLLLLNRGFGAFLVDPDVAKGLTHKGLLAAAALDPASKTESLLVLTADGTLYVIDTRFENTPATTTSPTSRPN